MFLSHSSILISFLTLYNDYTFRVTTNVLLLVIQAKLIVEQILFESSKELDSKSYTVVLSPTAVFRNLLPVDITYKLQVIS